jgi:hypothetical protein
MALIIFLILILIFTVATYLINKILPFKICPICAGVGLTWFLISVGLYTGFFWIGEWILLLAMGMGGAIIGISYQIEKKFGLTGRKGLIIKSLIILVGFYFVFLAINNLTLGVILTEAVLLAVLTYVLFIKKNKNNIIGNNPGDQQKVNELEKQLENCC